MELNFRKMDKRIIGFVWQESSNKDIFNHWNDGLRQALRIIERQYEVKYFEPWDDIKDVDVILYWEAPCSINGKNAEYYKKVQNNPIKKALLFAGGPILTEGLIGFDMIFYESEVNGEELRVKGFPCIKAFGINDEIFKPMSLEKKYDGMMQGTFASWKRQGLFSKALKDKGLLCGRKQETDITPYNEAIEYGSIILPEQNYEEVAKLLNQSYMAVNTADYWGGGQRCSLEAMACGIPVIVMSDSPKNREYIEESGFGLIIEPQQEEIRKAVDQLKENPLNPQIGLDYIKSKYTAQHYANNLLKGIYEILGFDK